MYSCTRTPTHRQNRRLPVFFCCLPARRLFSLSLTYSLLYGITKPPYNLLKGDASRPRLIHANVHARTPESLHTLGQGEKSRRFWPRAVVEGNCTLMQSRKRCEQCAMAFLWRKEIGRLNIIWLVNWTANCWQDVSRRLLYGTVHIYTSWTWCPRAKNSFNSPMIDCNIFTSTTRLTLFVTINVGVYDFSLHWNYNLHFYH